MQICCYSVINIHILYCDSMDFVLQIELETYLNNTSRWGIRTQVGDVLESVHHAGFALLFGFSLVFLVDSLRKEQFAISHPDCEGMKACSG